MSLQNPKEEDLEIGTDTSHLATSLLPDKIRRLTSGVSIASLDGVIGSGLFEDQSFGISQLEDIINETEKEKHEFNESLSLLQTLDDALTFQDSTKQSHSEEFPRGSSSLFDNSGGGDLEALKKTQQDRPNTETETLLGATDSLGRAIRSALSDEQNYTEKESVPNLNKANESQVEVLLYEDDNQAQLNKMTTITAVSTETLKQPSVVSLKRQSPNTDNSSHRTKVQKTSPVPSATRAAEPAPKKATNSIPEARRQRKVEGDKIRRRRRKEEFQELRDNIARMENERAMFLRTIEELGAQARSLEFGGLAGTSNTEDDRLRVQNNLLKQELTEEKKFVARLKSVMEQTCTTSAGIREHNARLHKMQLRRKCIECCENTLAESVGLAVASATTSTSSQWVRATLGGVEGIPIRYELLPTGSTFANAKRINLRLEIDLPVAVDKLSGTMRTWRGTINAESQEIAKSIQESTTNTQARILYSDDTYDSNQLSQEPVVKGLHVTERLNKRESQSVVAMMVKRMQIPSSCIDGTTTSPQLKDGIVHVSSNAKKVFEQEGVNFLTKSAQVNAMSNTQFYTPLSIEVNGVKKEHTKLIIVDSSPMSELLREGLTCSSDGSILMGKVAEKNCKLVQLFVSVADQVN